MQVNGTTQLWDLNGDGIVDIADLTLAIEEAHKSFARAMGIAKYIQDADPSLLPVPVKATVDINIG